MRTLADPPRLIDDPELGQALRLTAGDHLSEQELARSAEVVARRISAITASAAYGTGAATGMLAGVGAKVALVLIIALGAGLGGVVLFLDQRAPTASATAAAETTTPDEPAQPKPGGVTVPEQSVVSSPSAVAGRNPTAPEEMKASRPTRPQAVEPSSSDLPAQLILYDEAKRAGGAGDYERALALLDQLEQRFARTMLQPEIDLSRVDWLARSGRDEEALTMVAKMVRDPAHQGKSAQLYRLSGDLWRRSGDCRRAREAYAQALSRGLPPVDAASARRAAGACRQP